MHTLVVETRVENRYWRGHGDARCKARATYGMMVIALLSFLADVNGAGERVQESVHLWWDLSMIDSER